MTHGNAGWLVFVILLALTQAGGCDRQATSANASGGSDKTSAAADSAAAGAKSTAAPAAGDLQTAESVLEKMAAAYKDASTYEDRGTLEFRRDPAREQSDTRANFSVAFQRPNKLRVEFFGGTVVCDGKQWYAFCDSVPGQVVFREAPPSLNMNLLRADDLLSSALNGGEQVPSPQLQLLWGDNPIKNLMNGSQEATLDEPGRIGDFDCYRVRVNLREGPEYLWIDQKTFALRQLVIPIANGPRPSEGDPEASVIWLAFNFETCPLGG